MPSTCVVDPDAVVGIGCIGHGACLLVHSFAHQSVGTIRRTQLEPTVNELVVAAQRVAGASGDQ